MRNEREAADDRADVATFPRPPDVFTDDCGRRVEIREYEEGDRTALVDLYWAIERGDRAQGLPPSTNDGIRSWLDGILGDGIHLVAWHGDRAVGHACLLETPDLGHELAIFVRSAYQQARIGTRLLRALLGLGADAGVDRVWLMVERDNLAARNLYESAGFERVPGDSGGSTNVEMVRRL